MGLFDQMTADAGIPAQQPGYGTPPQLLDNLMQQESSGNPKAVNKDTGALGAYQFLPSTVSTLKKQGMNFDPMDAQQSRNAADFYIQKLVAENGGDYAKAMAQYGGYKSADPTNYVNNVMKGVDLSQQNPTTQAPLGGAAPAVAQPLSPSPIPAQKATPLTGLAAQLSSDAAINTANSTANQQSAISNPEKNAAMSSIPASAAGVASLYNPMNQAKAVGETALQMGTGALASAGGGLRGIYDLATGATPKGLLDMVTGKYNLDPQTTQALNKATQDIQNTQQAYTYQPKSAYGQGLSGGINQAFNAANQAIGTGAGAATGAAGGGDLAQIRAQSIGQVALPVLGTLFGGASALKGASSLSNLANVSGPTLEDLANIGKNNASANGASGAATPGVATAADAGLDAAAKPKFKMHTDGSIDPIESETPPNPIAQSSPIAQAIEQTKATLTKNRPDLTPLQVQRHAEAANLLVPGQLTDAQASGDVNAISDEMNTRAQYPQKALALNAQNGNLIDNLNALRNKVAPDVGMENTQGDLGQTLIDSYKSMDQGAKNNIKANYQAVTDANAGKFPLDVPTFINNANQALQAKNIAEFVPPKVQSAVLNKLADNPNMTFDNFINYDKILSQQQRAAMNSTDGATGAMAVGMIRQELNKLPVTNDITSQAQGLLDTARSSAKARFDALNSDPAYDAAINDGVKMGAQSPLADGFIKNYIAKNNSSSAGNTASVANMMSNLKGDPMAQQAIRAGAMDNLRAASGVDLRSNTGNVSQAGMNKAIQGMGNKLPLIFGDDADMINTLGNYARNTQQQPRGSYVNNSNTLVGAMGSAAKQGLEGLLNVKTLGGYGAAKNLYQGIKKNNTPPSSVTLQDLGKQ